MDWHKTISDVEHTAEDVVEDLVDYHVGWKKHGVYSAIDEHNLPPKKRFKPNVVSQSPMTPPNTPKRRKTMPVKNYMRYKKRTVRRRVKKLNPALSLAESKRHVVDSETALALNTQTRIDFGQIDNFVSADMSNPFTYKTKREGTRVWITGIKMEFHLKNTLTEAVWVRMLIGDKIKEQASLNVILKKVEDEQNVTFADYSTANEPKLFAPVDRTRFQLYKDIRVKLMASDQADTGGDSKHFTCWIPLNKLVKFEGSNDTDADWSPALHLYALSAEQTVTTGNAVNYSIRSIVYFKDP